MELHLLVGDGGRGGQMMILSENNVQKDQQRNWFSLEDQTVLPSLDWELWFIWLVG